jgi:hypothetical protein
MRGNGLSQRLVRSEHCDPATQFAGKVVASNLDAYPSGDGRLAAVTLGG